jgi:hypothetical protein
MVTGESRAIPSVVGEPELSGAFREGEMADNEKNSRARGKPGKPIPISGKYFLSLDVEPSVEIDGKQGDYFDAQVCYQGGVTVTVRYDRDRLAKTFVKRVLLSYISQIAADKGFENEEKWIYRLDGMDGSSRRCEKVIMFSEDSAALRESLEEIGEEVVNFKEMMISAADIGIYAEEGFYDGIAEEIHYAIDSFFLENYLRGLNEFGRSRGLSWTTSASMAEKIRLRGLVMTKRRLGVERGRPPKLTKVVVEHMRGRRKELERRYARVGRAHDLHIEEYMESKHRASRKEWREKWKADGPKMFPDLNAELIEEFSAPGGYDVSAIVLRHIAAEYHFSPSYVEKQLRGCQKVS